MWIGVVTSLLGALVVAEVGRRSAAGKLPRNDLVGLRMPATLQDDRAWDVAHRAAGSALITTGLAAAGLSVAAGVIGVTMGEGAAAVALVLVAVVLVGGVLWSARRGLRAVVAERS